MAYLMLLLHIKLVLQLERPESKKRNRKPAWTVNSVLLSQPKSEQRVPVRQRLYHSIFDTFKWMSFLKGWGREC